MSKIRLTGATSGYTELAAPAIAGNNEIKLPASNGAADQLLKNGATAGSLEFTSNVVIDSTGNLGLGTNSPLDDIHISTSTPRIRLTDTDTGVDHWINGSSTAGSLFLDVDLNSEGSLPILGFTIQGSERMRLDSNGRLGIGTDSPGVRLEVSRLDGDLAIPGIDGGTVILATAGGSAVASSGAGITLGGGNTSACGVYFGDTDDGDVGAIIYSHSSNSISFRTAAVNVAQFNSSGQLLLGGITPSTGVDYSVCTTGRIESEATYSTTTASAANVFIDANGLLARSTSSIKYKADVEDAELQRSEHIVFNSRPVWYRSLSEDDPDGYSYWGFIAEEVAEIDPRMVHWGNGSPEGVQYERYVVHLVNVIQKQKTQLESLEARIAALEAQP